MAEMAVSLDQPLLTVEVVMVVGLHLPPYITAHQPTVYDGPLSPVIRRDRLPIYSSFICLSQDNVDLHRKPPVTRPVLARVTVPWNIHQLVHLRGPDHGADLRPDSDRFRHRQSLVTPKHEPRHCPLHLLLVFRLIEPR